MTYVPGELHTSGLRLSTGLQATRFANTGDTLFVISFYGDPDAVASFPIIAILIIMGKL